MNNDYYIYFHINLVSNEVFYVGKGKGKRAWSNARRSKYWDNVVNKYGYRVDIIHENLSEKRAFNWEKLYISMFGRKDLGKGNLVNHTDGGEGMSGNIFNEKTRIKMSNSKKGNKIWLGLKHTDDSKEKISIANKGMKRSDESRKKMSNSHKGQIAWNKGLEMSQETKNKMSKPKSEEHKKKMSEARKLYFQNKKNNLQLITV